jgi:hypothetical protein
MDDDDLVALNFRIPKALKERLAAYAARNHMSVTVAVRHLLPKALDYAERGETRRQAREK